jgi:hypothetical protein
MADRDSNIALNLTGDDEPAVQQQEEQEHNDSPQTNGEEVENPDGSVTEYATAPVPDGSESTENVPESPFAAEIARFRDEINHPEDFSDSQFKTVGVSRLHPDLTHSQIAGRIDYSPTTVGRALQKADMATLSGQEEIHDAFQSRKDTQQSVIAAAVSAPDKSDREISEMVTCGEATTKATRRLCMPLIRKLRDIGLPDGYSPRFRAGEDDEEENKTNSATSLSSEATNESADSEEALDAEIAAFKEQLDHPDAYSEGEIEVIALAQTMGERVEVSKIADRAGRSGTLVRQAMRKKELSELTDQEEIHEKYHDLSDAQRQAVKTAVARPDTPIANIEELDGENLNTIRSYRTVFKPLISKLNEVGLPGETRETGDSENGTDTNGPYVCETCGKPFGTQDELHGHTAIHSDSLSEEEASDEDAGEIAEESPTTSVSESSFEPESAGRDEVESRNRSSDIETVRQFVSSLRVAAANESSAGESSDIQQSAIARKATCDAVIDFIDSLSSSETR